MPPTGMIAVARIEAHIYCISSTKRPGAYLKFRVRGGALNRVCVSVCVCVCEGGETYQVFF